FRKYFNIDARTNHDILQINPKTKTDCGQHILSKETFNITYDKLLIASGASPTSPNWEGVNLSGVHMLKTIPDAHKMMDDLHDDIQNVTVIGGGYIGLEMAESFRMLGKKVRLIHRSPFVGKIFDSDTAQYIHDEAIKHDIELMV